MPESILPVLAERKTCIRPTVAQSNLSTALVVALSILSIPFTFIATSIAYIVSMLTGNSINQTVGQPQGLGCRRTVLVTGARANKALTLLRAFKREGHRVVLAEEAKWGALTCARFSRAVDAYYSLPDPLSHPTVYIDALKRIVARERVDIWVPCSSVMATMVDSEAAKEIREESIGGAEGCQSFIPEPYVAGSLHWKDQFEVLCKELQCAVPYSKVVTSLSDAVDFLHAPGTLAKGYKYILKSLDLDDLGRDDLTLFPLSTREATYDHLSHIPTPISREHPFLLQRFLQGSEYCTHVAAREGQIVAFVACPSNPLLMRYCDVRTLPFGENVAYQLECWIQRFLTSYKAKLQSEAMDGPEYELTGHFSFDFIIEDSQNVIYPLECNVVSTASLVCIIAN
ncbi:hypothetical protein NM688_g2613 [Phlebia brevispora]|uniref:Uncharacterized protein n=1 Tax=Phlebia brevispora TaxID=194682 RepID=A0ACC1T8A5_9APHY|nr:hypothetical protein NM688_g2613 [Phlebia brevispora]